MPSASERIPMPGPEPQVQIAPRTAPCPRRKSRRAVVRAVFHGCWVGLLLAAAAEVGRVLWGTNFHTVVPGRVYRCAQLSGPALTRLIQAHGIRTVVNLRGCCAPFPWYLDECRATHHRDVAQEDVCFSAGRLPSGPELRRLVEVLDRTEYPILLHCRRGADRTGTMAAFYRMGVQGWDAKKAYFEARDAGMRWFYAGLKSQIYGFQPPARRTELQTGIKGQ